MKLCCLALATILPCLAAGPDIDKGKALGGINAPVVIEVYSSFACSHCKDFHEKVLPMIIRDYVVPGKVCVINRETFPPNFPVALEAANDATAAARIGKYQQVADALFKNQQLWVATGRVWETVASVLSPSEQKEVEAWVKTAAVTSEVQRDMEMSRTAGVTSTPTLLITHASKRYPIAGVPEYSIFKSFLDTLLATK